MLASFNLREYLLAFGYLPEGQLDGEIPPQAIAQAQAMYGLPETGVADESTIRILARTPRCGVTDVHPARAAINQWGIAKLTYYIESVPTGVDFDAQRARQIIRLAFDTWQNVGGLSFTEVGASNQANIIMGTGRGNRAGFDGPSGTLAWAQLPSGGNYRSQLVCRSDLDERWSEQVLANAICWPAVLRHEMGHLGGLDHSQTPNQLLNPYYNPRILVPQSEDIARWQSRYGKPAATPNPPSNPPTNPPSTPGAMTKLEVIARLNGDDRLVFGPIAFDLTKPKAA